LPEKEFWKPSELYVAAGEKFRTDNRWRYRYYEQIERKITDQIVVRFLLICPNDQLKIMDGEPRQPFYIMQDKVWNDLFAHFADLATTKLTNTGWTQGGQKYHAQASPEAHAQAAPIDLGVKDQQGQLPVFRVTLSDATSFAQWLVPPGVVARLPHVEEWKKAAGFYEPDRGEGPFKGMWNREEWERDRDSIAIDRGLQGPMNVGDADRDISPLGCRDMAGNGFEWTSQPSIRETLDQSIPRVTTTTSGKATFAPKRR
jgi:formylglycine-generating enzyme required for sulfatase activity